MCGIVGVALSRVGPSLPPLAAMNAALAHRGPDDRGVYWSPDSRVGLAQCRLAVLDLSPAGHQPMSDPAQKVWITFNGEIYNFVDLRAQLEKSGFVFRSGTDTEVVIAAYLRWGDDFLQRLNGMFALALYDSRSQRLLLARDRAGEKPLFFYHAGGRLLFASELKALLTDPTFPRTIDPQSFESYLAYGYVTGDRSIFRGVRKVPQGHALAYDLERDAIHRWAYWRLPDPPATNGQDPAHLETELESLLEDAVRRQLVADVPVAILLSGGLDSSLITAMAARAQSRVKTFTVTFPGDQGNEAPYARTVANHFGTDHVEVAAEPTTVDLLPLLARQFDEPIADHAMVPMYLVSRLVRAGATVALGGDGGDELFAGYPHYSWLLREERLRRYVPAGLRSFSVSIAQHLLPMGTRGRNRVLGFEDTAHSLSRVNLYFDAAARHRLIPHLNFGSNGSGPEVTRSQIAPIAYSVLRRGQETDFRTTLVDGYLVKVDRASMLNSLEVRAPFLDQRLIEFAFGKVPDHLKATERERKILLRRVAGRLLPPELDLTRKQGLTMPLDRWFKDDWGAVLVDVLSKSEIFDHAAIHDLVRLQKRGLRNAGRLYALAFFEIWRREYGASLG